MRFFYARFFLLITFIVFNTFTLLAQIDSLKARKYYQKAEALLLKGKSERAIRFLEKQ